MSTFLFLVDSISRDAHPIKSVDARYIIVGIASTNTCCSRRKEGCHTIPTDLATTVESRYSEGQTLIGQGRVGYVLSVNNMTMNGQISLSSRSCRAIESFHPLFPVSGPAPGCGPSRSLRLNRLWGPRTKDFVIPCAARMTLGVVLLRTFFVCVCDHPPRQPVSGLCLDSYIGGNLLEGLIGKYLSSLLETLTKALKFLNQVVEQGSAIIESRHFLCCSDLSSTRRCLHG